MVSTPQTTRNFCSGAWVLELFSCFVTSCVAIVKLFDSGQVAAEDGKRRRYVARYGVLKSVILLLSILYPKLG